MKLKNKENMCVKSNNSLKAAKTSTMSWWILWHTMQPWEMLDSQWWWYWFTWGNDTILSSFILSTTLLWNSSLASVDFLSSHFHLSEIQQGTKYLWCFNPTCQCAGAFAFICSALLRYTLHIWRPSIPKSLWLHSRSPRMFKLLQETELLDLFIQLPRLRRDTQCLQLWPATRWLLWLVCINKKRQIITTNSIIKLTGHKTERDYRVS